MVNCLNPAPGTRLARPPRGRDTTLLLPSSPGIQPSPLPKHAQHLHASIEYSDRGGKQHNSSRWRQQSAKNTPRGPGLVPKQTQARGTHHPCRVRAIIFMRSQGLHGSQYRNQWVLTLSPRHREACSVPGVRCHRPGEPSYRAMQYLSSWSRNRTPNMEAAPRPPPGGAKSPDGAKPPNLQYWRLPLLLNSFANTC